MTVAGPPVVALPDGDATGAPVRRRPGAHRRPARLRALLRRTGVLVRETCLTLLALGGLLCLVGVVAAHVFGLSLMLFKTGSMSPTIPAGSVALARELPATAVEVGDVVTVEREDRLPVTHRVIAVDDVAPDGTVTLRMRGDANAVDDPAPYVVRTVRKVEAWVPLGARTVARAGDPMVLGGVTLAVSALVTWSLWPRTRQQDES